MQVTIRENVKNPLWLVGLLLTNVVILKTVVKTCFDELKTFQEVISLCNRLIHYFTGVVMAKQAITIATSTDQYGLSENCRGYLTRWIVKFSPEIFAPSPRIDGLHDQTGRCITLRVRIDLDDHLFLVVSIEISE